MDIFTPYNNIIIIAWLSYAHCCNDIVIVWSIRQLHQHLANKLAFSIFFLFFTHSCHNINIYLFLYSVLHYRWEQHFIANQWPVHLVDTSVIMWRKLIVTTFARYFFSLHFICIEHSMCVCVFILIWYLLVGNVFFSQL